MKLNEYYFLSECLLNLKPTGQVEVVVAVETGSTGYESQFECDGEI